MSWGGSGSGSQGAVSGGAWMLVGVKSIRWVIVRRQVLWWKASRFFVAESRRRGLRGLLPGRHMVFARNLWFMASRLMWSGCRPDSIVSVVRLVPGAAPKMVARAQVSILVRACFQLGARAPRTGAAYSRTGLMQLV